MFGNKCNHGTIYDLSEICVSSNRLWKIFIIFSIKTSENLQKSKYFEKSNALQDFFLFKQMKIFFLDNSKFKLKIKSTIKITVANFFLCCNEFQNIELYWNMFILWAPGWEVNLNVFLLRRPIIFWVKYFSQKTTQNLTDFFI